jgi:hypothetical protein
MSNNEYIITKNYFVEKSTRIYKSSDIFNFSFKSSNTTFSNREYETKVLLSLHDNATKPSQIFNNYESNQHNLI